MHQAKNCSAQRRFHPVLFSSQPCNWSVISSAAFFIAWAIKEAPNAEARVYKDLKHLSPTTNEVIPGGPKSETSAFDCPRFQNALRKAAECLADVV